jgi:hypothetical protein
LKTQECICEKEGSLPSLYWMIRGECLFAFLSTANCFLVNQNSKRYGWHSYMVQLSCSKFNYIVQKAAVQNYEFIWLQFNQLRASSWPILRLRDFAVQYRRHIFLFGRKLSGVLLLNSLSKECECPGNRGS